MQHLPEFKQIISQHQMLMDIMGEMRERQIPDCYIGSGAVTQTIWNHFHGFEPAHGIKDIDIVFFDPDNSDKGYEEKLESEFAQKFAHIPFKIDLTNEVGMHLWHKRKFGIDVEPYISTEHAISGWVTTSSAIGTQIDQEGEINVCAPFGLDDLMNMVVKANKKHVTREVFEQKAKRWQSVWSQIEIIHWDES